MIDPRNPFDIAPGEPLFPPVERHTTPREPSAPERRLYVALLPCGCTAQFFYAPVGSEQVPREIAALREQGYTVLEHAADVEPLVRCAEHASGVEL